MQTIGKMLIWGPLFLEKYVILEAQMDGQEDILGSILKRLKLWHMVFRWSSFTKKFDEIYGH